MHQILTGVPQLVKFLTLLHRAYIHSCPNCTGIVLVAQARWYASIR